MYRSNTIVGWSPAIVTVPQDDVGFDAEFDRIKTLREQPLEPGTVVTVTQLPGPYHQPNLPTARFITSSAPATKSPSPWPRCEKQRGHSVTK